MRAEKLLECLPEASYTIIARELKGKSKCCKQWYSGKTMRKGVEVVKKIYGLDRERALIKFYT